VICTSFQSLSRSKKKQTDSWTATVATGCVRKIQQIRCTVSEQNHQKVKIDQSEMRKSSIPLRQFNKFPGIPDTGVPMQHLHLGVGILAVHKQAVLEVYFRLRKLYLTYAWCTPRAGSNPRCALLLINFLSIFNYFSKNFVKLFHLNRGKEKFNTS
jgi:hypothetical protein